MRSPTQLLGLMAAALLAFASPRAEALAIGTAELKGVHVRLVDLDLNDGITPALDLRAAQPAYVYARLGGGAWDADDQYGSVGSAMHVKAGTSAHWASSELDAGDVFGNGQGASARASASVQGDSTAHAHTNVLLSFAFSLTPNTQLVMTADSASATVTTSESGELHNVGARLLINVGSYWSHQGVYAGSWLTSMNALEVSFENRNQSYASGIVDAMTWAWVQGVPNAVPEPASGALVLGGLLTAFAGRRRARRA